jgi:hypothetical protein
MSKLHFSAVAGLLFSIATQSIPAFAETQELQQLDTTYISSDTVIVVVAHPQRVLARKSKTSAYANQILEMFKQQSGIDAKNLRQVVLQFGTETTREDGLARADNESISGVFRFDKPVDPDAIAATGFKRSTKANYKGKTYFQPNSKHQPALWFPNNRTMIVGIEWRILKLIDEPKSMGLMVSRMRQADMSADLLVEVDVQRAEPLLLEAFRHVPEEEPFAPRKTIEQLTRVTLTAKLSTDTPLSAQFHAKNAKSAEELGVRGKALLTLAKAAWSKQRDMVRERARGEEKEMVDAMIETIDTILAGTKFAIHENRISVNVEKKGGAVDLITLFMGMTMATRSVALEEAEVRRAEAVKEAEDAKAKAEKAVRRAVERKQAEERKRQGR